MRKLRRLPWRIPKTHGPQHNSSSSSPPPLDAAQLQAAQRAEAQRELLKAQPVAFAGGRYVYGCKPAAPATTEIRRKSRQRPLRPLIPVAG